MAQKGVKILQDFCQLPYSTQSKIITLQIRNGHSYWLVNPHYVTFFNHTWSQFFSCLDKVKFPKLRKERGSLKTLKPPLLSKHP